MAESEGKGKLWVAVAILIAAAAIIIYFNRGHGRSSIASYYFIDEETGEESVRPVSDIPPLPGKSGKPTVVREYKYSLDGGSTVKVGYYLKFDDGAKKKLEDLVAQGKNPNEIDTTSGQLVRSPDPGSKWVSIGSGEGQTITHLDIPQGKQDQFMAVLP